MSILQFNGPQLGQKIRMVLQTLPSDHAVLVAESNADTSALSGILSDAVHVQKGMGKINCVGAHRYLTDEERRRALFLVDCDGEDNQELLSKDALILSENRDLESDMFFRMRSFEELLVRHFAQQDGSLSNFRSAARECHDFVLETATRVGLIRDIANRLGLQTRLDDILTGKRRKVGVRDLKDIDIYCSSLQAPTFGTILAEFRDLLGWTSVEMIKVRNSSENNSAKKCRMHNESDCLACKGRRFANGHELVDLGARVLAFKRHGSEGLQTPGFREFEHLLRASVTSEACADWPTVARIRRFESWGGFSILRTPGPLQQDLHSY
ncbi:hypothetical protein ACIP9X_13015 [Arthrobacter sp. NPDC093125]|uniref:hypothetical protein n=1 Tax=Arthrobacter sp. NPDC093125 TaxID=3363944 RepID=UPI0038202F52